jgi:hypothetical protein
MIDSLMWEWRALLETGIILDELSMLQVNCWIDAVLESPVVGKPVHIYVQLSASPECFILHLAFCLLACLSNFSALDTIILAYIALWSFFLATRRWFSYSEANLSAKAVGQREAKTASFESRMNNGQCRGCSVARSRLIC